MMRIPRPDQAATLRRMELDRRAVSPRPPVLAVTSGKGGVGKTLLSVNLSLEIARTGRRCLLVDLDPGLANVDVHLRLRPAFSVLDVFSGKVEPEEAVLIGPHGLRIVPGGTPRDLREEDRIALLHEPLAPSRILEKLAPVSRDLDLIVLDTGAGIGPWVRGALDLADLNLLVTQPDPASVTDAYALLKVAEGLRPGIRTGLVVNRVRNREEALLTATRLGKVSRRFLGAEPDFLGWFPDSPEVRRSIRNQHPFCLRKEPVPELARNLSALCANALGALKTRPRDRVTSACLD